MNSKQRRQCRRFLARKWPLVSSWNHFLALPDYEESFCKEFTTWRKAEGLTVEMLWDRDKFDDVYIRFRKPEAYAKYLMRWPSE